MKTIRILLPALVSFIVLSCGQDTMQAEKPEKQPANFIVLLDLSDRILKEGQAEYDIEMAFQIFEEFEKTVRQNLTINSKDRFCILIADQQNTPYSRIAFENQLYMDMDELQVQEKNKKLEDLRANLKSALENLYATARYSEEPGKYSGSDLWRFFHDRLPSYLIEGAENHLMVLSDGYFDFESGAITSQMASMGTTTGFLNKLRNRTDWRSIMEEQELGIYPTGRSFTNINTCMAGIRPKYQDLSEIDMLIYTWEKWLNHMGVSGTSYINFESTANAGKKVREWLN